MTEALIPDTARLVKQCCARLYESELAKTLLGDSFHPGGLRLTERLGTLLSLTSDSHVLDVASGNGTSAFFLAEHYGCQVVGIDYGAENVQGATELARITNASPRARFQLGDAERLDFPDAGFDAVVCECAFCTFPDKSAAAREFFRVLRPGGRVGISDITRAAILPKELEDLLAWASCIADARSVETYTNFLRASGFSIETVEPHNAALAETARQVQGKLLLAKVMAGLKKIELPEFDFTMGAQMAKAALSAIESGQLGYAIIVARSGAI